MAFTDDLARRIKAKRQELAVIEQEMAGLEQKRLAAKAYIEAMDDAMKLAERSGSPQSSAKAAAALRKGSMPAKAYPVLKHAGRPMYITALAEAMHINPTIDNKRALASALSAYARKGEIFTRPEPNTFGLVEFGANVDTESEPAEAQPVPAQLKFAR